MAQSSINSSELISTVNELAKERRVNKDVLFSAIEAALISAYKKNYGKGANVRASIDRDKGEIEVLSRKTVVEEVNDPQCEMTLQEAREIDRRYEVGDLVEVPVTPARLWPHRGADRQAGGRAAFARGRARRDLRRVQPEGKRDPHRHRPARGEPQRLCGAGPHGGRHRAQPADARRGACHQRPHQGLRAGSVPAGPRPAGVRLAHAPGAGQAPV